MDRWPLDRLRSVRGELQEAETGLSYLRRLVQGRLDIVAAERARRDEGGAPGDLADLVERLPGILAERTRAPGVGRLPQTLAPGRPDEDLEAEFHRLVARSGSAQPDDNAFDDTALDDAALGDLATGLADLEHRVSQRRSELFETIDALAGEITRRYRTGEATVDELLR